MNDGDTGDNEKKRKENIERTDRFSQDKPAEKNTGDRKNKNIGMKSHSAVSSQHGSPDDKSKGSGNKGLIQE